MAYIVGIDRNQTRMVTSSLDDLIDENNSVRVIFVRYAIEFLIIIRVCVNHMYSFIYNHAIIPFIGSAARSRTCCRPFGE